MKKERTEQLSFKQFLLPDGREELIKVPVNQETKRKGEHLLENGMELHVEILRTGEVLLTVFSLLLERDIFSRLAPGDLEALDMIEPLINEAFNGYEYVIFKTKNGNITQKRGR